MGGALINRPTGEATAEGGTRGVAPAPRGHRWFAATYDLLTYFAERRALAELRPLVAGGAAGRVLEVGVGTGANLPYYPTGTEVAATDPDPFMLERARRRAAKLGRPVELHCAAAESLPFPDASFDAVVSTLVLCTVADPARALAEIRRVLKPGGTFRFIEHVRADGPAGRVQDLITPLWRRVGAGCHPNRRTAAGIEAAGFALLEGRRRSLPLTPLITGIARRGKDQDS